MNPLTPQQLTDIAESLKAIPHNIHGVAAWKRAILYSHPAQNGGLAHNPNDHSNNSTK